MESISVIEPQEENNWVMGRGNNVLSVLCWIRHIVDLNYSKEQTAQMLQNS